MTGPSPHLTWGELACHDEGHSCYPLDWRETRAVQLAEGFEVIREACGHRPIRVGSAYRTPEYNATVGGVPNSQHVQGRALDLYPPDGLTVMEFFETIRHVAPATMIRFIMLYPSWGVHVDCRPSGVFRIDSSLRPEAEVPAP